MLCEIHEHLKIKDGIDPEFVREAISTGNEWSLEEQYPGIFASKENSEEDVRFVSDILEMWWMIESAYKNLSAEEKAKIASEAVPFGEHVKFSGFCGNYECTFMGIAGFLVNTMDKFSIFRGRQFNSHVPLTPAYRRMLAAYLPMRSSLGMGRDLSAGQITTILNEMHAVENTVAG
jgi:uncharacterized protein YfbU (UPF0304 family)